MLLHLHVKNLALIREAEIDFSEGLNRMRTTRSQNWSSRQTGRRSGIN